MQNVAVTIPVMFNQPAAMANQFLTKLKADVNN